MGTRSTITFFEKRNDSVYPIVSIYQHYDGYLEGVGEDLCKWLMSKTIVNGLPVSNENSKNIANGIGCLIAQYIAKNKTCVGDLYIIPIGEMLKYCDYNYTVIFDTNTETPYKASDRAIIGVDNWGDSYFFKGSPEELLEYIKNQSEDDE